MLIFFHSPRPLTITGNKHSPPIKFLGSDQARQGSSIPFSHIYVTSTSQFNQFKRIIRKHGGANSLVQLPPAAAKFVLSNRKCPINLSFREQGIEQALVASGLQANESLKIAVINGMGTAYGDNIVGLGALQHFQKFLAHKFHRVEIDLVLRRQVVQRTIHSRYKLVNNLVQLPISVSRFYQYDAFIDMSDALLNPDFNNHAMMDYCLRALSMQKIITEGKDKRTSLNVPADKVAKVRKVVIGRSVSRDADQKIVLFHPQASSPLRTMPDAQVVRLLDDLLASTEALFVHCVPVKYRHERLIDMSDKSRGFNELADIIACCDAVITVGTVTYHVSGNLDIPTFLIPTVEADVRSAAYLHSVTNIVPETALIHLSSKHKSTEPEDLQRANLIWQSIRGEELAERLNKALNRFSSA